ncbi:unnamed protein product [Caenorhabditis brenneri]
MSERFKYATNGICRYENFAEHLVARTFPTVDLGFLCGTKWYFELKIDEDQNEIVPLIYCDNDDPKLMHNVQIYFNMLNNLDQNLETEKRTRRTVLLCDEASGGAWIQISKILDPKNGWLDDGILSFEYGIQVEAIMKNDIWTFNFNDKLFNAGAEQVQFDRVDDPNTVGPLYAHKVLLSFHSTISEDFTELGWTDKKYRKSFIHLLQVCHGVRLILEGKVKTYQILEVAFDMKMMNVLSYCDWNYAQTKTWDYVKVYGNAWILFAIKYNLRHFLASMLKSMTSLKGFIYV